MKFSTFGNDIIDKEPTQKERKKTRIIAGIMLAVAFAILTVITIILVNETNSIEAVIGLLGMFLLIIIFSIIVSLTTLKDYVEIEGNEIKVVDFKIFRKKEQHFTLNDIKYAKIENFGKITMINMGGYREVPRGLPSKYIVFKGHNDEYLFKMKYSPEREFFWQKHVKFDMSF